MPVQRGTRDKSRRSHPGKGASPKPRQQAPASAPSHAPQRKPGAELQRLDVFVGSWRIEGDQLESPLGPAAKVDLTEHWEWLPGGFFLVNRLNGHIGTEAAACVEVLGYDNEAGNYVMHSYYSDGHRSEWLVREKEGTWTYAGTWDTGAALYKIRCTQVLGPAGDTINSKWEYAGDGSPWKVYWDVKATRS